MTNFDIKDLFDTPIPTTRYRVVNIENGATVGAFDTYEEAVLTAQKQNEGAVENGLLSWDPDGSPVVPANRPGAYYVVH